LRIQAFCLCETLAFDSPEVEAIGLLTAPDFGDYWSPDEAFFDILRDKPTINAMVKEIAGKGTASRQQALTGFQDGRLFPQSLIKR